MNEAIGAKGGNNDRYRTLIITKKQYQKLKEYEQEQDKKLTELEIKKLKINQLKSVIISIPLVTTGTILKELVSSKELPKEQKVYLAPKNNSTKKVPTPVKQSDKVVEEIEQKSIPLPESEIEIEFENIKNHEIISRYETKLKEIKAELKELIYEYNIITNNFEEIYESKVAKDLLDKLNTIIKKLEKLKKMIDIPNIDDFDQNYIYDIISEYLSEFEKSNVVKEIKDSELYILISSKLAELDDKREVLSAALEEKKAEISIDEETMKELKEKYNTFDSFNNDLLKLKAEQDILAKDFEEKIKKSTSTQEQIEVKFRFLHNQSHIIMDLIAPQLLIPGIKSGVRLALITASLVHIMRNHIGPTTETHHYNVVSIIDYTKDITNSINDIDKGLSLLKKSKKELEGLLVEFREKYKQYFGKVKECDKLFSDLEEILESLKEKEEELEILKQDQEKNLAQILKK